MRNKTLVTVFLVVALAGGVGAQRGRRGMAERPAQTAFDSDEYRLRFSAPDELNLYTREQPGRYAALFAQRRIAVLANPLVSETIDIRYSGRLTEADVQGFRGVMEKDPPQAKLPGFEKVSVGTVKIGLGKTKDAVDYVYKARAANADEVVRQVVFVHDGSGFMITCSADAKRYGTASKLFDRFLQSLEFK